MCTIAGNNIFNQWHTDANIISGFCDVPLYTPAENSSIGKDYTEIEIVAILWSYNIYRTKDSFYISGIWGGKKVEFRRIILPPECSTHEKVLITGNDYYLFFVQRNIGKLWIMDESDCVKEITFNEAPVDNSPKRRKEDYSFGKIRATNDSFLCHTDDGIVYAGLLPSLVNTKHCTGSVCDISCGYEHCMLLTDVGRVYTWGNGRRLQLGHGDLDNLETPTEVEALAGIKIVKICAGGWHSAALSEFGDLYVWGWNDMGQLGTRSKDEEETDASLPNSFGLPTLVDIYDSNREIVNANVKDIACGSRHTAIILEDNSVWTSGCNKYGQLGLDHRLYPKVSYYKNTLKTEVNCKLMCGPWTTVLQRLSF
ncbi:serine/threonine-protein kinase Nek9 [Amyelois transitella]|uniref:serine/threonine-protein kinase Nek9 n=1 Tax=Amyelois transitella TaxID=680683 RepID=UPI002990633B|nr:serine/threonine-protein kinase Nek9 [Amyelois transitella]